MSSVLAEVIRKYKGKYQCIVLEVYVCPASILEVIQYTHSAAHYNPGKQSISLTYVTLQFYYVLSRPVLVATC